MTYIIIEFPSNIFCILICILKSKMSGEYQYDDGWFEEEQLQIL